MDKKDLISLFQELRLHFGKNFFQNNELLTQVEKIINNSNIDKLDIKRMYRYLDKNVKKDVLQNTIHGGDLELDEEFEMDEDETI
jgi:hypothetical protein